MCYVYILRCSDNTFYTGWTNNLKKRIYSHQNGKASKYTRSRLPVTLVYFEEHNNKVCAQKREYQIKQMTRAEKTRLIESQKSND
jgi:putative endonuclease